MNIQEVKRKDDRAKAKMKVHADARFKAKTSRIDVGDLVLVRQRKQNKLSMRFDPSPFRVTSKRGTMITARRNGKYITCNTSHFKLIDSEIKEMTDEEEQEDDDDCESTNGERDASVEGPGTRNVRRSERGRKPFKHYGQNIYEH